MSSKIKRNHIKNNVQRACLALGAIAGSTAVLSVTTVASADTHKVNAGDFDLTKQASSATFPVMFDRPSGVNAAALAATVRNLGTDSDLYRSAVAAVPEIANASTVSNLLNNALSDNASTNASARATIVKLINWYNTLGGVQIKTQAGQAYTTANLDQPINVLAVAFSNNNSISSQVSATIDSAFKNVKTVADVEKIVDSYASGTSTAYRNAFNAYAAKVYANGADISALSSYANVKPVLDAYEKMYADGAAAIRKQLLAGQASSTEAGVTFFESAVITGQVDKSDSGSTSSNTPQEKKVTTKWVDESGNNLANPETGTSFKGQKDFNGYTFKTVVEKDGVRTYTYTKTPDKKQPTVDTVWVDESGKVLKAKVTGSFPDNDGKSDIPGYTLVSTKTTTDSDGNSHVVNTYKETPKDTNKPDTYWFDDNGKQLREPAIDQTLPDNDGVSDIPGYTLLKTYTVTQNDLDTTFKGTTFGIGDTINIYTKNADITTRWVDENGKDLKNPEKGDHSDKEGDDIPGYTLTRIDKDKDGNITNHYKKTPDTKKVTTSWVDENGKNLKDSQEGSHPDKEGDDIPGYTLTSIETKDTGDVVNHYTKTPDAKKVITKWVDTKGNKLKEPQEGSHPDNDGKSDIPGYKLDHIDTDTDGNVTNVYSKIVTTRWVDENGKDLQDAKDGSFPDNDGKSDIEGYELDITKGDKGVEVDKDGNVINHYKKVAKVTTRWVDENGKDLQNAKEGSFPDNDGKSDIEGYELDTTKGNKGVEVDKDGNVINHYKKTPEAKNLITHWVDTEGNRLADDENGDKFGDKKTFEGYTLKKGPIDKGNERFYIYEKTKTPQTPQASPKATPKQTATRQVKRTLPNTGEDNMVAVTSAAVLLSALAGITLAKRDAKRGKLSHKKGDK